MSPARLPAGARVLVRFDDEVTGEVLTWARFADQNAELPELGEMELVLADGGVWTGGGGASPAFTVRRFPTDDARRLVGHVRRGAPGRRA